MYIWLWYTIGYDKAVWSVSDRDLILKWVQLPQVVCIMHYVY